jgi:hypothetical protein
MLDAIGMEVIAVAAQTHMLIATNVNVLTALLKLKVMLVLMRSLGLAVQTILLVMDFAMITIIMLVVRGMQAIVAGLKIVMNFVLSVSVRIAPTLVSEMNVFLRSKLNAVRWYIKVMASVMMKITLQVAIGTQVIVVVL